MSKIKQYLPEDIDVTDSRAPDYRQDNGIDKTDYLIYQLLRTIEALQGEVLTSYKKELEQAILDIDDLLGSPF